MSSIFTKRPSCAYREIWLPCSTCPGCLQDRALAWSIRSYQESQLHIKNSFITLTYSDDNLPSDGKISVDALQKFFKRVRKKYSIRYLACGEYGSQTRRPHYHALIFGHDFRHLMQQEVDANGSYTSPDLEQFWPFGHNVVAPVSMSTCCYVAGYVNKKQGDEDTFRLSSRRPPIGKPWFDQFGDDVRRTGHVVVEGKRLPCPPQYFDWDECGSLDDLKAERQLVAKGELKRYSYFERRARGSNRAINQRAKLKLRGELL